jgi:hypothetical protein
VIALSVPRGAANYERGLDRVENDRNEGKLEKEEYSICKTKGRVRGRKQGHIQDPLFSRVQLQIPQAIVPLRATRLNNLQKLLKSNVLEATVHKHKLYKALAPNGHKRGKTYKYNNGHQKKV